MHRQTVIITGISTGIGRACALRYAKAGYDVAGFATNRSGQLFTLGEELTGLGANHLLLQGDASDSAFVSSFFERFCKEFGHLDVLINNAGVSRTGTITELTDATLTELFQVNLASAFYCCRSAVPCFLANRNHMNPEDASSQNKKEAPVLGRILNVSSVFGVSGASCEIAYSATKAGLNALTQGLAKELAPSAIAVNALACGVIDTAMNDRLNKEERIALAAQIPVGRFAAPSEVAEALYLLSRMPGYLTGQIICFDGGYL